MVVIRSLMGTVGVDLGLVLLVLGIVLAPVLILLAPIPVAVFVAWEFWRLRHQVERGVKRERRRVRRIGKKVAEKL